MKVKCIDNTNLLGTLTLDKIYAVKEETDESYYILDDINNIKKFLKYRFEIVEESEILTIAKEIGELAEKKDKDYNNSFAKTLMEYGSVAYFLRIDDKLNRLKNLMLKENKPEVNKSVEDTLKDIAVYTLLMLKEIKNK